LKNVRINGGKPLENPNVIAAIERNQTRLGDSGRLLIRPSGTEPVVRVMAEGDDEMLVQAVVHDICEVLENSSSAA
jgi:phosphoglucosamine mutase